MNFETDFDAQYHIECALEKALSETLDDILGNSEEGKHWPLYQIAEDAFGDARQEIIKIVDRAQAKFDKS